MSDQVRKEYEAALHAMQSGVLQEIENEMPELPPMLKRFLKHERVGINSALCDQAAMVRLFIQKGLFTEAEYVLAIRDEMRAEQRRYEQRLSQLFGFPVTLA